LGAALSFDMAATKFNMAAVKPEIVLNFSPGCNIDAVQKAMAGFLRPISSTEGRPMMFMSRIAFIFSTQLSPNRKYSFNVDARCDIDAVRNAVMVFRDLQIQFKCRQ
jgi:hypothetical protein